MSSRELTARLFRGRKQATSLCSLQQRSFSAIQQPRSLPPEHFDHLNELTNKLVEKQAKPLQKPWQVTKSLRGEEKALANAIQKYGFPKGPVLDNRRTLLVDDPDDDLPEYSQNTTFLPGTLVELRR
jgi:hypothetical protein